MNLNMVMASLSKERKVFCSEADFQHSLAWKIHELYPNSKIRLEFRYPDVPEKMFIDLWVVLNGMTYFIELKYKTRPLEYNDTFGRIALYEQTAQDLSRYDFIKDIVRLERILSLNSEAKAYVLMLTNDPSFWLTDYQTRFNNKIVNDLDFRIHEGAKVGGMLKWGENASVGTRKGREAELDLKGIYDIRWVEYSTVNSPNSYGLFKYLLLDIDNS